MQWEKIFLDDGKEFGNTESGRNFLERTLAERDRILASFGTKISNRWKLFTDNPGLNLRNQPGELRFKHAQGVTN